LDRFEIRHADFSESLNGIAEKLEQYLGSENDRLLQEITEDLNRHPGLLARLFPSEIREEEKRLSIEKMRMIYEKKEMFFEFYSNVKMEIAKRLADALVAPIGMDLQSRVAAFASEKMEEISEITASGRKKFMENMKKQLQELEEYRDFPELYEPARASMKQEITIYFESVRELLQGFIEHLEQKVSEMM
jgi:hypothetical protein